MTDTKQIARPMTEISQSAVTQDDREVLWLLDAEVSISDYYGNSSINPEQALEIIAAHRIAAEQRGALAERERCAGIVDQCNRDGPYNAIGAAKLIRTVAKP
jgi:hypothetical protein